MREKKRTEAEANPPHQSCQLIATNLEAKKTPKVPKAPKLLSTPKLTAATLSLEDFMKQKNPTEIMDKYAVVGVWYKEQFQISELAIAESYGRQAREFRRTASS